MAAVSRLLAGLASGSLLARLAGSPGQPRPAPGSGLARVTRRGFVRNAVLGAVGVVLAETAVGTYLLFKPNKTSPFGGKITVAAAQVPAAGADPLKVPAGKFWLVRTERGLIANYWKCVHLGCTVPWVAGEHQFHCPCHGSIYSPDGQYRGGPAPRSLDWMTVTVNAGGSVVVDTGVIHKRAQAEPADDIVVPYPA